MLQLPQGIREALKLVIAHVELLKGLIAQGARVSASIGVISLNCCCLRLIPTRRFPMAGGSRSKLLHPRLRKVRPMHEVTHGGILSRYLGTWHME